MGYWGYPRYVTVAEKKAKALKKLKKLKKKMPNIKPVVIEGNALARTWWGKSWNKNLERYADYTNRIGRGRSYVRHGAVLDLKIDLGRVTALVQGSTSKPYEVVVDIKAITKTNWKTIRKQCEGQLKSLQDLLAGKFPKALGDIFFTEGKGMFPGPKAITFNCSCPDWAYMCKHVAATLYGIGARFDEDPSLFFKLRKADTKDLIDKAVKGKTEKLLAKTKNRSAKVIDDANLSDIFGIDMDGKPDFAGIVKKTKKKQAAVRRIVPILRPRKQGKPKTATDLVAELIVSNKPGMNIENLVKETGYPKIKLYGIVHRLKQQGKIKNKSRGLYVKS